MSYDINLLSEPCTHCGRRGGSPDEMNPTYNLTPIFDLALTGEPLPSPELSEGQVVLLGAQTERPRGLRVLSGRKAKDTYDHLLKAIGHLKDPAKRAEFEALEPPNKWGTLKDAVWVLERMAENAKDYPENVWDIR